MLVLQPDKKVIEECLAAYRAWADANLASAPPDIRASLLQELGSFDIVHLPDDAVLRLEATLPAPLPSLLIAYASVRSFSTLDFGEYLLPAVSEDAPLHDLAHLLQQSELWPAGYMQFATTVNGDPVCFDLRSRTENGDYPVVSFNHDLVPRDAWAGRESLLPYAHEVAPSFRTFFTGLCFDRESILSK